MLNHIVIPLILTFLAGLSTVIGGFLTFFVKRDNLKALSVGLAFSAGVMIFLALTQMFPVSREYLEGNFKDNAYIIAFISFFSGILMAFLVDFFLPDHIDNDLFSKIDNFDQVHKIKRAGILTAIAITIHNFPEGLTTFFVSSHNLTLGISIALAIAIHNIPEGIAVALPIYHSTGKKRLAIWYSFLSGISEPIGAVLGFMFLSRFITHDVLGILFSLVAGIMVYISIDTLLPLAREYGDDHHVLIGILSGMFIIGLSIIFI